MLMEKIQEVAQAQPAPQAPRPAGKPEKTMVEEVLAYLAARQFGRTLATGLARGLLGVLGLGGKSTSRRKSTSWF